MLAAGCENPGYRPVEATAPDMVWSGAGGAHGGALWLGPNGGGSDSGVLSLACKAGDAEMVATIKDVPVIPSEERLTLGLGDEPALFVVTPRAIRRAASLEAEAPVTAELLAALRAARNIGGAYGARNIGPYGAPPAELTDAFADRCQTAAGLSS